MQVRTKHLKFRLEKYLCDICGCDIKESCAIKLSGTTEDNIWQECDICSKCVLKVNEFISSIGGKVRIIGDEQPCEFNECGTEYFREGIDYIVEGK